MKRRLLSVLLVMAMVLSMVPATVTAADVHVKGTHAANAVCQKCKAAKTWTAWTSTTTLPTAGHYYLTGDVTVSDQTKNTDNLCLCLNGYTINGPQSNKVFSSVVSGKAIAIMDCTAVDVGGVYTAGKITGTKNLGNVGGAVYVANNNSAFYLCSGIIEGNEANGGAGIAIANGSSTTNCGKVFMTGGEIRNNVAAGKAGGAVQVGNYGQFFHTGGKITGNEAKLGGGIYAGNNATVAVKNATITGNHATENGGGVYFSSGTLSLQQVAKITGNTAVNKETANNVYLPSGYNGATANALTEGAQIGVTLATGTGNVTTVHSGNNVSFFSSDSGVYEPVKEDNRIVLKVKPFKHEHCACGVENCTDTTHGGTISYTKWDQTGSLPKHGEICLTESVTLTDQVVLDGDLKICLHGETITGPSNKRILASVSGYTLTISDCTADYDEEGNYTAGQLTGAVSSASNGQGGAINIGTANDTLYLYDGIITNNQSYVKGGAVNVQGTMYMYDGEISGNKALDGEGAGKAGGGICVTANAKLYVYGGTIKGNEAKTGAGIYADTNTTVVLQNVQISGNIASETAGGVTVGSGSLTVGGQTKITGNTANGQAQNLVLLKAVTGINANTLSGDAKIGVTLDAGRIGGNNMNITTGCNGQLAGFFESDDGELTVAQGTEVYLKPSFEHIHCVCGEKGCTAHGGQIEYLKWSKTDSLPKSGNYCLTENVTVTSQTVLTGDLNLCLHDKTITGFEGGRIIASNGGHKLTISDCQAKTDAQGKYTAGKLEGAVHSAASNNSGGAIYIGANDKLYLYDGMITGNAAHGGGGAIQVGGALYMYGGEISNNKALNGKEGGGINVAKSGKAYLYGGTICDNEARVGAGIYCLGSELVLAGVKIVNNKASEKAGGVFLADNCAVKLEGDLQILGNSAAGKASNLVLPDKVTLQIGTMGANAKVAVDAAAFRYISGETADCAALFQSDAAKLDVIYKDGKLYMDAADGHKHCLCTAAASGCDHSAIKWAPWEESDKLPTSGNYYLTKDVTVSSQAGPDGTKLNLCLNGHTIKVTQGRAYYLKGNSTLNISDCTGKGVITGADASAIMTENKAESKSTVSIFSGTFKGNTTHMAGGALAIQGGSTLNVYGGVFEGNNAIGKLKMDAQGKPLLDDKGNQQADNAIGGGAISMYGAGTTLNIYGGTFKNNKTTHVETKTATGSVSNKGGYGIVYIQGKANIYGGSFTGGEALLGGAFFVTGEKAELNIQDVNITGNTAKGGGAIVAQSGSTVNLTGGTVADNTCAGAGGGAIYVVNATLNMTGGKVTGNSAPGNGGALYISAGTANLTGGEITGNTADVNGGGVYVNRAKAIFNGTAVKNNTAKNNGGAVYGAGAELIQLDKSTISDNTAKNAGGIYATQNVISSETTLYSTVVVNEGAVISGNKGEVNCGGLMLVGKESVLNLNGGTITGNSAKNGGGVLAQTSSTVNFSGGKITGNKASVGGGGMYISVDTKLNMTGGIIEKNDATNNGGGMLVQRGIATIKGGSISGNTATTAAGVYFAGAKADIYNISITGNTAGKNCGGMMLGANEYTQNGVKMTAKPVVNMYNGTISGNAAPKANAGGVLLQSKGSTLNLKGGSISNNTCGVGGGAVYVSVGAILNMTSGTMTGNEAKQAGAIFCQKGEANITGGKIYGNKATALAGALLVNGDIGVMTVKNMDIHSNTAPSAGAIEVQNFGTINMENCKVRDNESVSMAGGVYVDKVSFANLKDVQIYNNNCTDGGGGGMAVAVGATVKADNITVENNRATGIGGGIYNRGRLELNGSVVRANSTTGNGGGIGTFKTSSIPLSVDAGLFVKNSLITDNRAVKGAGLYLHVGCISELTDVTVEKNNGEAEGSGIFSGGQTTLTNVTVTGNTSSTDLYALYFDAALYDGHTYYTGKKVLQGKIVVKDNQGGEAYLGEGTAIAIPGEGLAEGTYLPITLHSGLLTRQVIGIYNYEGENLKYLITAGNRSVTEPEQNGTEGKTALSGGNDWILYGAIGLFALAVIAVLVILLVKKKKKTPAAGKE